MRDLYLSDLLEGEQYETFDGRVIYINKITSRYFECYEKERATNVNWSWNLRTERYLRQNIRTILEVL